MKNSLLLAITIFFTALTSGAAVEFPTESVLSSGRWIKVRVDSTGVQRIPYEKLRSWGFDHPEKVAVYGFGSVEMSLEFEEHPVTLPPVQVAHKEDALFFYGEGETRYDVVSSKSVNIYTNRYSRGSYYFLSQDVAAAEMTESPYEDAGEGTAISDHVSLAVCYPREFNPADGGAYWYSRDITEQNPYSVKFALPGFNRQGYMGYKVIGKHTEINYMTPQVSASAGVTFKPDVSNRIYRSTNDKEVYRYMSRHNVASFTPGEGVDEVTFTVATDPETDVQLMCLDNMWVTYMRDNVLNDAAPSLSMHFLPETGGNVNISTADKSVMVWDVTDVRNVTALATESVADGISFSLKPDATGTTRKVEAFIPGAASLPEPRYEGIVPNTNLHAGSGYDMVIIAAPDFMPAAGRLAAAHASRQGLEVLVTSKEDVLNEFGSGSFTPNGLRLLTKMLHDRDGRLKYVLLIGAGFYDNASVASLTNAYIPAYQAELQSNAYNVAKAYTSDSFYGYVEDHIAPDISTRVDNVTPRVIDIAVGRFPVFAAAEAELLVDKTIAYMDNPVLGGNPSFVMMMADKGNENQHMQGAEDAVSVMLASKPGMTISRCYDAAYLNTVKGSKNTTLISHIRSGFASDPSLVTYAGHGSKTSMFSESFINRKFYESISYGAASVFLSASCHPYTYDYEYRGMLSDLLLKREGGFTAVIGPAREVYLKNNQEFCNEFAARFVDPSYLTIGDVYRSTMSALQDGGQSVRTNALSFNLGGDPALPLPRITADVALDKPEGGKIVFHPGRKTRLSGEIRDTDGSLRTDFNGTLTLQVFDAPVTFLSHANVASDNEDRIMLTLDETLLAETTCSVSGGKWEAQVTVPAVSIENGNNRVAMLARPEHGFAMAAGFTTDATVAPYDAALVTADTEAPDLEITIDDALASDNRVETSRTPCITVTMSDSGSGISMNRAAVGASLSVTVDGNRTVQNLDRMVKADSEGVYSVSFTPDALSDGRHTVPAHVTDNAGNHASAEVDFFVVEQAFVCSVGMDSDVVTTADVTFSLEHPLPDSPGGRFVIEDLHGRHVASRQFTGDSLLWDLKDDAGKPVADGSYRVYAVVKSHPRYSATAPVKFTVIR
ncbi:MAG: hypothetical protein K2H98_03185 [Duncaniella sp.]|nr:hypothetical protein [Duncaniella sp.]